MRDTAGATLTHVLHFLNNACPDHHVRGRQDHRRAAHTAMRLLEQHPEIRALDLVTAVVTGDVARVREVLAQDPAAAARPFGVADAQQPGPGSANDATRPLGAKGWTPLLFLSFTRLPLPVANEHAVEIAELLLTAGADPNAFFRAGDSRYTPMVGVIGEGEEDRPAHPQRDQLTQLLLDHGAEPNDGQVVYNLGFKADYVWWLELIHARAVATGRMAGWDDPRWPHLDMGGYGCGARWVFERAIRQGRADVVAWCIAHGASVHAPPGRAARGTGQSLIDLAVAEDRDEIVALFEAAGAAPSPGPRAAIAQLTTAALAGDATRVATLAREQPELLQDPAPLCRAAERNRVDTIELLVTAGFSVNAADATNTRALNHAAWSNQVEATAALLRLGAEVDAVETNYGGTAFGNASHFLHEGTMRVLEPVTRDVWNLTYNGSLSRLREVLAEDPSRARVDWDTWSPLLWLPPHDEALALACAELLVSHGADPQRRSSRGESPADRAEALAMPRVAAWLREAGGARA